MDDEYYLQQTEILAREMIDFVLADDDDDEICCNDEPSDTATNSNFNDETDTNCSGYLAQHEESTETDGHFEYFDPLADLAFGPSSPYVKSTEYASINVRDIEASLAQEAAEAANYYDDLIVPPTTTFTLRYNVEPFYPDPDFQRWMYEQQKYQELQQQLHQRVAENVEMFYQTYVSYSELNQSLFCTYNVHTEIMPIELPFPFAYPVTEHYFWGDYYAQTTEYGYGFGYGYGYGHGYGYRYFNGGMYRYMY